MYDNLVILINWSVEDYTFLSARQKIDLERVIDWVLGWGFVHIIQPDRFSHIFLSCGLKCHVFELVFVKKYLLYLYKSQDKILSLHFISYL